MTPKRPDFALRPGWQFGPFKEPDLPLLPKWRARPEPHVGWWSCLRKAPVTPQGVYS